MDLARAGIGDFRRRGLFAQTPDVYYVPTQDAVLGLAQVTAADLVDDPGSCDVCIVSKRPGPMAGIELDAILNKQASKTSERPVSKKSACSIVTSSAPRDFSATVVTFFLSPRMNQRLQPKLQHELKPGARVVSHRFPMLPEWNPDRDLAVEGTHVFLLAIR